MTTNQTNLIKLPSPITSGGLALTEAIALRRSVRRFDPDSIQLFQLSQILWAAQGTTGGSGKVRSIPSAGATYPLEVYAAVGETGVENLETGLYHYEVNTHALTLHLPGDMRAELSDAALGQDAIAVAPVSLIICAVYDRTMIRYNIRGERYVFMEVGHAGQNVYLQASALGLGTVVIGAFRDDEVREIMELDVKVRPLYIMPIGKKTGG